MQTNVECVSYLNYVNGQWQAASSGQTIDIHNPANKHEIIGRIQASNLKDLDQAVANAKEALSTWKNLSPVERGNFLHRTADILEKNADEIAEMATKEMGKIFRETKGEVLRGVAILRYYAQEGMRQIGEVLPSSQKKNILLTKRVPVGVVGVISPWNFPIAIPIWKIAPALVYGNTVVFKPASETGITAAKIVQAFDKAGLPKGVLNLVNGKGSIIGQGLADHKDVNAISFTGSNQVGKQVAVSAVHHGARYQLEMGGKNPVIIMDDADLEHAAELTIQGAMKQTGQRCTATSRAYVHQSIYERVKELVIKKANALKVGNGFDSDVDLGPLASEQQMNIVMDYIEKGKEEGATLLCGGEALKGEQYHSGYFVPPTVFENVTHDMTIARDEIFGPVLALIKINSFEEAVEMANDTPYGLSASIFTKDIDRAFNFIDVIETGLVQINGETGGAEPQAPFGGMKESSSQSREQGQAAKEFYTTMKTITITPIP
ncbi:alpha-ketoglutaric semialdehyde dehydrogenase GucD [Neobacillus mesonae]|uniref:alpha-ketoglutaric semialdehyde dehydrogenase GucD n=1 Tax=Neobacillus mesonae TaxID=1193713 RepID=UPI002E1CC209|nr:aldehyde dehydrogenase family protein [Neobacillus mesonae]